jgi:hypothetical protein
MDGSKINVEFGSDMPRSYIKMYHDRLNKAHLLEYLYECTFVKGYHSFEGYRQPWHDAVPGAWET